MRVSVIVTVKNEESSIATLLDSLLVQTRRPDEVILADGGSTDGTVEIAKSYISKGLPLHIVSAPGSNISQGRNAAIRAATGEVIACTDAGVRLDPKWLEIMERNLQEATPAVIAGFFQADPHTLFETALGATTLPDKRDVNPSTFLPSSRSVAFPKEAWERVGGYPEWLDYCEDLVFDLRLRAAGYRFLFDPEAVAYFRPRPTLRAFFRQYYHYARGDGKADLWRQRHLVRYTTYLVLIPLLLALALFSSPLWLLLLAAGGLAYTWAPYRRLWPRLVGYGWPARLWALCLVPIIRATGDVAKMLGYPVGLWWRWQHRSDPRLLWRHL